MVDSVAADQKPHVLQRLIWVYIVCSGLSVPALGYIITVSIKGTALDSAFFSLM